MNRSAFIHLPGVASVLPFFLDAGLLLVGLCPYPEGQAYLPYREYAARLRDADLKIAYHDALNSLPYRHVVLVDN